jgi:hypothetical protein
MEMFKALATRVGIVRELATRVGIRMVCLRLIP